MDREDVFDAVSVAVTLLGVAAKLWPELHEWIDQVTQGRADHVSLRVRDVLGTESLTEKAMRELG